MHGNAEVLPQGSRLFYTPSVGGLDWILADTPWYWNMCLHWPLKPPQLISQYASRMEQLGLPHVQIHGRRCFRASKNA